MIQLSGECPSAPWHLRGDAIAIWERHGVRLLVRYTQSPVGAYNECALAQLNHFRAQQVLAGRVFAPTIVQMQVDSERSMQCGRALWGFPKTLSALNWQSDGRRVIFSAPRRTWRFRITRVAIPVSLRTNVVQVLAGQNVRVPVQIKGRARLVWRGRQWGVLLEDFRFTVEAPLLI